MKKLVAVLLTIALLLGCGVTAVSAVDRGADYQSKLSAALIEKLNDPDADQIDVCIFLKNAIHSDAEVEQIISERYTWTTQQEHLMCWRKVVSEIIGAYVQRFIDDNADLLDEVLWHSNAVEMIEATVSKENVYRVAELDTVSNMDLYVEAIPEPDIELEPTIEEKIVDAANELYHPSSPFPAEDIMMEFSYQFRDSSVYAVRFIVKDVEYICIELVEPVGDWLLYSGYYPEPYIFADNKLYTFKEAYEGGILSEVQLEELCEVTRAQHSKFCLTRYIKGDADGDGECNIIDATVIQRVEANISVTGTFYKPLADVDGDSEVSVIDATLIQRKEAGLYSIV